MKRIQPKIVYSENYDIRFYGLESFHPFDGCKYSRAWQELTTLFKDEKEKLYSSKIEPKLPISTDDLKTVHSDIYLKQLENISYVAQALEFPLFQLIPDSWLFGKYILKSILEPMRWATMGTVMAAIEAVNCGIVVNLSGGYHHASKNQAEGFCIYSDIAIAIAKLRQNEQIIKNRDKVLIIDLDAHQGNGLERIFQEDEDIYFFDMYNKDIYPGDKQAKKRINYKVELPSRSDDKKYLSELKKNFPLFLDEVSSKIGQPKIAFYNAGTDIYEKDPLGGLKVSASGIQERDAFIFNTLTKANIPLVMLLSGGYTRDSYRLVAKSVEYILRTWRNEAL